jgi:hypothetical protein
MRRSLAGATAVLMLAGTFGALAPSLGANGQPADPQHSRLQALRVLPAKTFRDSPESGAFFSVADRTNAAANNVPGPATGAYFADQPVQGFSNIVPAGDDSWWALSDNGYGARGNSADYQLAVYRIDPQFDAPPPVAPTVIETVVLSDPDDHVTWKTVCDPVGTDLPPLTINTLPAPQPACAGSDRILTGFDFDPESMVVARDGTFWFGDEFGPFLLHTDATGRLLEAPIGVPGVKAPQNPTLDVLGHEEPNVASSRGFEGMAISPDGRRLHPVFEGPITGDHPQDLRILTFDLREGRYSDDFTRVRLEMPGQQVNLAALLLAGTEEPAYEGSVAPPPGRQAIGDLKAVNRDEFLFIERDSEGDGPNAPRFKKVFLLDTDGAHKRDGYVAKQLLIDLLAVPDPDVVGGDGDFFRFPFNTIEGIHVVDDHTVVVVNDNNFPFSNGRARSRSQDRSALGADDNELILVGLGTTLDVDDRLLETH